jgi:acetyltransferase-like isoleucine patch superfamily enzyme
LANRYPEHQVGTGSYGEVEVLTFGEATTLEIGAYCSFASGVQIMLGGGHRMDWVTTYPFTALDERFSTIPGHPISKGDVRIGHDVWVGREALILSGVTIGSGAVIGARAVVSRDVAPYTIVAGNPAGPVRSRFAPDIVAKLLAIAWWDWPDERIDAAVPYLLSPDIKRFISAVESGSL